MRGARYCGIFREGSEWSCFDDACSGAIGTDWAAVSSPSKSSLSVSEACVVIGHTAVGVGDLLALTSHSFYTSDLPVLTRRSY